MPVNDTDRVYEEMLVTMVRSGDERAFERLAVRWQPRLMRTAGRLLGDAEDARIAVQESWIGIVRGIDALSDPASFPAWAFGILRRKCADRIKKNQSRRGLDAAFVDTEMTAVPAGAEDRLAIRQAMSALGPDHRITALLYFQEGLTSAEVAVATGVPVGTAKSRIFNARRMLKSALEGDEK